MKERLVKIDNNALHKMARGIERRVNEVVGEVARHLRVKVTHSLATSKRDRHYTFKVRVVMVDEEIGAFEFSVAEYECGPYWVDTKAISIAAKAIGLWRVRREKLESLLNELLVKSENEIDKAKQTLRRRL